MQKGYSCSSDAKIDFFIQRLFLYSEKFYIQAVHRTFPPHIFSIQVKSGACYITGQSGRVQNE